MVGAVALGVAPARTHAQVANTASLPFQQRFLEEQLRPIAPPELRTPAPDQPILYDCGAILRYTTLWYEDHGPDIPAPILFAPAFYQGSRAVQQYDVRPWASVSHRGVHNGFVRGQFDYLRYNDGDEFDRVSDWQGPFVDLGYYRFDVDQAFREYHGAEIDTWDASLIAGRQFLFLGRGMSLALNLDAATWDWACGEWTGIAFAGQSIRRFNNIDLSVPGFTRSDREFYGAQVNYEGLDHHSLYAYGLVQRDRSDESPDDFAQEYDYDSEYAGVGADGEVLFGEPERPLGVPNLHYFSELILQRGRSFGRNATEDQDPIRAWAFDFGLTYYLDNPWRPRLIAEYARGSGDADRQTPQNTVNGNFAGTTDHGFLGFGFVNTGVCFAPLLANLEFVRLGGATRPFDRPCTADCLRDLELGASFFSFWRPVRR